MKEEVKVILNTKATERVFKRFHRSLLWHLYPFGEGFSNSILELLQNIMLTFAKEEENLANKIKVNNLVHHYQGFYQTNTAGGFRHVIKVKSPEQMQYLVLLELYDKCQMHLKFLWINSLISTSVYQKQSTRFHNLYVNFVAQVRAQIRKNLQKSALKEKR